MNDVFIVLDREVAGKILNALVAEEDSLNAEEEALKVALIQSLAKPLSK